MSEILFSAKNHHSRSGGVPQEIAASLSKQYLGDYESKAGQQLMGAFRPGLYFPVICTGINKSTGEHEVRFTKTVLHVAGLITYDAAR